MFTKLIDIVVHSNWNELEIINTFNPEENAFILTTGCGFTPFNIYTF